MVFRAIDNSVIEVCVLTASKGSVLFPKSECFTRYDAFGSYIFDYASLKRKAYCYQKGSKLWKNCIHQKYA